MIEVPFEFDAEAQEVTPMEGVAVLYAYDSEGEPVVLYGTFGCPTSLAAIGLYNVALDSAKEEFFGGDTWKGEG